MTDEKYLLFQHYEKPTASKNILHAQSSQSVSCKNSVHTQEILHRILNTSPMLDLSSCVAPVLTDYMLPMMRSGYPEKYRLDTLNPISYGYRPSLAPTGGGGLIQPHAKIQ